MTAVYDESLSQICRHMKSGALRCADVTEALLARATEYAHLNAYASLRTEQAIRRAQELDQQREAGQPMGALFGVPIAVKDLVHLKGEVTASGTLVMADFRPNYTATIAERLEAAGAVLIGKTQLTEGAYGVHHPDIEAPRNPWSHSHWPGVSSSGSGVAVAARLAFAALGTDTGGSIRFPSASCGVVGIKPTYGRVSRHGVFPLGPSLDHVGPLARSVEDAARVLTVLAGHDPLDTSSSSAAVPNFAEACLGSAKGLRVGVDRRYISAGVEASVVVVVEEALDVLRGLGLEVVEFSLPATAAALVEGWAATCSVECAQAHADYYPQQAERYGPTLAELIDFGGSVSAEVLAHLEMTRGVFQQALEAEFERFDVMICPAMPQPVPLTRDVEAARGQPNADRAPMVQFTAPFNYSGHPSVTLPMGLDTDGLPQSVQLVGPLFGEAQTVNVAAALERARPALAYPYP